MRLTFVLPAIGKKPGKKYIGTWKMEPLTFAVLKSLTPERFAVRFFDDRLEQVDASVPTDAVLISVETYTARRSYALARRFREQGAQVILGGYHASLMPEEAGLHADAVVVGNAEAIFPELLEDLAGNRLQPRYQAPAGFGRVPPDLSLYGNRRYLPVSLVETGRGCPQACEFCAISACYRSRYHPREVGEILRDLEASRYRRFFLVDDNLCADREHALELFRRMEPLGLQWAGQGTLAMGQDPELLQAMKRSGCEILLVGFESLNQANLRQMGKSVNLQLSDRDQMVRNLHAAGLNLYGTFVFGYDADDLGTVREALDFAVRHGLYTAAFNHLLPFPGTRLHERLLREGRLGTRSRFPTGPLDSQAWWLDGSYRYGEVPFKPRGIEGSALARACRDARKQFNSPRNLIRRGALALKRGSLVAWPLFWAMNLPLGREVDQKMDVPLGENLDEWPK